MVNKYFRSARHASRKNAPAETRQVLVGRRGRGAHFFGIVVGRLDNYSNVQLSGDSDPLAVQARANAAELGPNWRGSGQVWPSSAAVGRPRARVGQALPSCSRSAGRSSSRAKTACEGFEHVSSKFAILCPAAGSAERSLASTPGVWGVADGSVQGDMYRTSIVDSGGGSGCGADVGPDQIRWIRSRPPFGSAAKVATGSKDVRPDQIVEHLFPQPISG